MIQWARMRSRKYLKSVCFLVLYFGCVLGGVGFAEIFHGPERTEPGAMFIVQAAFQEGDTGGAKVAFDQRTIQFLGTVVPSSDIQVREGGVEIMPPGSGGASRSFGLKFIPIVQASSTELILQMSGREAKIRIQFVAPEAKGSYHLHLLGIGVVLLALGFWFWSTQKKHVGLMSTRSLFLNFEEMEKVRAQMFPETVANPESRGSPSGKKEHPEVERVPSLDASPIPSGSQEAKSSSMKSGQSTLGKPTVSELSAGEGRACGQTPVSATGAEELVHRRDPKEVEAVVQMAASVVGPVEITLTDASGKRFSGNGSDELTIGRRNDCTIVLTAAEVSRTHCVIRRKEGAWVLVPQTTTNRTELNGIPVNENAPQTIKHGDTLGLGGTPFIVEIKPRRGN